MNIFVIVLVFIFMGGWFLMDAPSQKIHGQDITSALTLSDLRSLAECTAHTHNDILSEREPSFQCTEKYNIGTNQICVDANNRVIKCVEDRNGNFPASYIVTNSDPIDSQDIHNTMKIIQELFPTTTNFGVLVQEDKKHILMIANGARREIPETLIKDAKLANHQLLYITKIPVQVPLNFDNIQKVEQILCAAGQVKVMRFGKWQCVSANSALVCTGDMIWSTTQEECILDPRRRPLCASNQTAVQIDDYWECIDPFPDKQCPPGTIERMNYTTMEWECVQDPNATKSLKKCTPTGGGLGGRIGTTARVPITSCTDCEEMVTNPETCETYCVPSASKINDVSCYRGTCSGARRAFYFGFPNLPHYIAKARKTIPSLENHSIPIGAQHSQNRRFNCLDCGNGYIDSARSIHPYVAVCVFDKP